ncbi:NIF3 1 [Parasphaerochaeta coccoides]|uniref:NGG1p interacting factor NIF3 n=1 Tax=Parasphaerochaeta coccoides (strain ATCC BAA-1237 / DSM 17374 / SPN1) TaxID=760011 RepID=F4GLY4_PARC1|nr:NIF3 1 [Parasphaerochaeta coccoides]AEC03025.1 hypothetical protein Spico_1827 [Parasphaerochaeta coccoides DSM 17374]
MFLLVCYVPEEALDKVKEAAFSAGAGRIGDYSGCCWETCGRGQFIPGEGSSPYLGQKGKPVSVKEWRIEFIVSEVHADAALAAVKGVHPYEEPVSMLIPLA